RMRAELAAATALLTRYVHRHAEPDTIGAGVAAGLEESCIPRYYIALVAERVVSAAFELTGHSDPDERRRISPVWQDRQSGPVLQFTNDHALEVIGKTALGIDPADRPRWL